MNKKAMELWMMVTLVLSAFFIVAVAVMFVPRTIDSATDFINVKLVDWSLKTETIPDIVIDEERIEEGTKRDVESIPNTKAFTTGGKTIVKQVYGDGWSLVYTSDLSTKEFDKEEFAKKDCPVYFSEQQCTDSYNSMFILLNKPLIEILSSEKLIGIITINGRDYAHTINPNYKLNADGTPTGTSQFIWVKDATFDENGRVSGGTEIKAEEVRNLLLTELYEEAQ